MTIAIRHRGPDADGTFVADGIALGHRRLSIIDLSPTGAQPMTLRDGGPTISYNGEIYNFQELRSELKAKGCTFRGTSDTEVILQAYATWGMHGLKRLEGIFALALWDAAKKRLVLMRDRLGVKPLFYAQTGDRLAFGSEIGAIMAAGIPDQSIDDQALSEYLWYGNAYEDRTIYRGIRQLLPGHWMVVENGATRIEAWWKLEEWLAPRSPMTQSDGIDAVRDALAKAVRRQLIADVPVGLFLSGGLDSSSIAYAAAHDAGQKLQSFACGFDFDAEIDELAKARRVADVLGLEHHELRVTPANLSDALTTLARSHGEPFADAANIPLYLLCRELSGTIKVVLQGDGGDEMFAGYRRSVMLQRAGIWSAWPSWLSGAMRALPGTAGIRLARMADAMRSDSAKRMALLLTVETPDAPPTAYMEGAIQERLAKNTDPFLAYRTCDKRFGAYEPVQRMLLTDIMLQLASEFLPKVDRATMASGIEARVPLLDEHVASLATGMAPSLKVRGRKGKVVLREAMRGRLPDDILDAPKTGFNVPYQLWLRRGLYDFARDVILDPGVSTKLGFNRAPLEAALAAHKAGTRDHGFMLWKYLQLGLWSKVMS